MEVTIQNRQTGREHVFEVSNINICHYIPPDEGDFYCPPQPLEYEIDIEDIEVKLLSIGGSERAIKHMKLNTTTYETLVAGIYYQFDIHEWEREQLDACF